MPNDSADFLRSIISQAIGEQYAQKRQQAQFAQEMLLRQAPLTPYEEAQMAQARQFHQDTLAEQAADDARQEAYRQQTLQGQQQERQVSATEALSRILGGGAWATGPGAEPSTPTLNIGGTNIHLIPSGQRPGQLNVNVRDLGIPGLQNTGVVGFDPSMLSSLQRPKAEDLSDLIEHANEVVDAIHPPNSKNPSDKAFNNYYKNRFFTGLSSNNLQTQKDTIAQIDSLIAAEDAASRREAAAKDSGPWMISPQGVAYQLKPGMPMVPGSVSVAGYSSEMVPTAATRQMAETAPKVKGLAQKSLDLIDQQINSLGPIAGRWSEYWAGKVGVTDTNFVKLRTNVGLLQTALMRMHVGARGGMQIMEKFSDLINAGKMSPENMRAALQEIIDYANDIEKSGDIKVPGKKEVAKPEVSATPAPEQEFVRDSTGKLVPKK